MQIYLWDVVGDRRFGSLVKPDKPMGKRATEVTGITDSLLEDAPSPLDVAEQVFSFFEENSEVDFHFILAHNMKFDQPKLVNLLSNAGFDVPTKWVFIDTLHFCRYHAPGLSSYSIRNLLPVFANSFDHQSHRAGDDVAVLWEILSGICRNVYQNCDVITPLSQFYLEYIKLKESQELETTTLPFVPHKYNS
eukprot:Pompholyxophrys_punicea_v1_NODE_224_length_2692_cov_2.813045.p2 type:complete len:192 gc:universal NODE_224_length_2692_cov_2.813045:1946-2521(+)